jgi:hypothetical protein
MVTRSESEANSEILQCIDDGLNLLGESGKRAANYYLKKNGIRKEEIPAKPETLREGLEGLLGELGAEVIENWIVQKLRLRFDLDLGSRLSFAKAVRIIKTRQKGSQ